LLTSYNPFYEDVIDLAPLLNIMSKKGGILVKGIIDRLEGDLAVVELDGHIMKNIYVSVLPIGAKEGDVIIFQNGKWALDRTETQRRRAEIEKKTKELLDE
jgi:hypothetical protein